jgi:hypothetical protein
MTTNRLSPAAQAVLDAFIGDPTERDELEDDRHYLAAALREAAEQLGYHIVYDYGEDYRIDVADLLAIAAELEQAAPINTTEVS